jgi:hypothetical protein
MQSINSSLDAGTLLRVEDPTALKEIVLEVQSKANSSKQGRKPFEYINLCEDN